MLKKIVSLVTIASICFVSCKSKQTEEKEILRPVRYQEVGKITNANKRNFNGVAVAREKTELSFRNSGIITVLKMKVGQKVKKGDMLAKLDNIQANLGYEQTIASLNTAKSAMNTAKSSLERTRTLYEKGSASLSDYE